MVKLKILIFLIVFILILSCNLNEVDVTFRANAVNSAPSPSIMWSVDMGNGIVVEEYNVKYYKIEIGNSENDKFTLWEDSNGQTINLANATPVELIGLNPAIKGTYKFCRITIDKALTLDGTYTGLPVDAVTYNVTGNCSLDVDPKAVFLFGTSTTGVTGNFLLTEEIVIEEGTILSFVVNLAGKVSAANPPVLTAPTMTFTAQ
jgi:hypothetical protein